MHESTLKFRELHPEDYGEIKSLLEQVKWEMFSYIADPDLFKKLLDNTDRNIVAVEGSRIVGVATAMCNDVSIGYITMLAVSPDKQGYGIGSQLIKKIIGNDPNIKWILSSVPGNDPFWEKQGFVRWRLMVKARGINKFNRNDPNLTSKQAVRTVIRNQLRKIYRLNICQCHQSIKSFIRRIIR